MQYGLDAFRYKEIEPEIHFETVSVENSIPEQELRFTMRGKEKIHERILMSDEENVTVKVKIKKEWKAPVKKGEKAGKVIYYLNGSPVREYEVVTANKVEELTWKWCLEKAIKRYIKL